MDVVAFTIKVDDDAQLLLEDDIHRVDNQLAQILHIFEFRDFARLQAARHFELTSR